MNATDTTTIDRAEPVDGESWPPPADWVPVEERIIITAEELDALVARYSDRRKFIKAAGHGGRRTRTHVLEAAHDLADQLARVGGANTDGVQHCRSEIVRIRA